MRCLITKEKKLFTINSYIQSIILSLGFFSFIACLAFFLFPLFASFKPLFSQDISILKNERAGNSSFISIFIFTLDSYYL